MPHIPGITTGLLPSPTTTFSSWDDLASELAASSRTSSISLGEALVTATSIPTTPSITPTSSSSISAVASAHLSNINNINNHGSNDIGTQAQAGSESGSGRKSDNGVFGWNRSVSIAFFVCISILALTLFAAFFYALSKRKRRNGSVIIRRDASRRGSGFTARTMISHNWRRNTTETNVREATSGVDVEDKAGFRNAAVTMLSNLNFKGRGEKSSNKVDNNTVSSDDASTVLSSMATTPTPYSINNAVVSSPEQAHARGRQSSRASSRSRSRGGSRANSRAGSTASAVVGFSARYSDEATRVPLPPSDAGAEAPDVPMYNSKHRSTHSASTVRTASTKSKRSTSRRTVRRTKSAHSPERNYGDNREPQRPSTASSATSFWKNSAAPLARSLSRGLRGGSRPQRDVEAEIMEIEKEVDLKSDARRSRSRNGLRPTTPAADAEFVIVAKRHDGGEGGEGSGNLIPVYQRRPTPMALFEGDAEEEGKDRKKREKEKAVWKRGHVGRVV